MTSGADGLPPRKPRVVIVNHTAQLGGAEIALLTMLPLLKQRWDVTVLLCESGRLHGELAALQVPTVVVEQPVVVAMLRRASGYGTKLKALASLLAYALRLRRHLLRLEPDVVYCNTLRAALLVNVLTGPARKRGIWHIRDRISADYLSRSQILIVRALMRVCRPTLICNSRSTAACLRRSASVVASPIADEYFAPVVPRVRGEGLRLVMVGRISPWKGQHVALAAFAAAFRNTAAEMVFIGSPLFGEQAYADDLRVAAADLGVQQQVTWAGFRMDVPALLDDADVLVHASTIPEPFGQVIVQGMARGLTVIAADSGGPAEVITPGEDGILYETGSVTALTEALRSVAADAALRLRLGKGAIQTATRYRATEIVPQVSAVIAHVAALDRRS